MPTGQGQLLTFKEALEGQILDKGRPDRVTIVKVSVDFGNQAPSVPPGLCQSPSAVYNLEWYKPLIF